MVFRPLLSLLALVCLSDAAPRARAADGTLVTWGDDHLGQVSRTPAGSFSAVAAGGSQSVAIRTGGTLVSWVYAGLIIGTPAGTFYAVAAGGFHRVAIRTDGIL